MDQANAKRLWQDYNSLKRRDCACVTMYSCGGVSDCLCWSLRRLVMPCISCCRELCEQIKNFSLKPPFCVPYHEKIYDSISVSYLNLSLIL